MSRQSVIELLEPRTLFAGVTILATGMSGTLDGWVQTMANEITARLGGPAQVPQYVMSINPDPVTGGLVPSVAQVAGTGTPQSSSSGEILLLINYYNISASASWTSAQIGSAIGNYLLNTPVGGIMLASLPIHEVGLSRGAAVMDGVSQTLGQAGVWVDQETYLDPHPITSVGDPAAVVYDNVAFADDYWRTDGSASGDDDGEPVSGAYNLNVAWLDADSVGYATPHLAPGGYYNGTIDLTATQGGDGPIYSNWYGDTPQMPARGATGFLYSSIVGGARPSSGVWAASGGTGVRTPAGQIGPQWGNAADLTVTSDTTITTGDSIQVSFIHQDRASADTITFYLDTDRNPYNNNFVAGIGSVNLAESDAISQGAATLSATGVPDGTYWLCAKITNAQGFTRYTYNSVASPLTIDDSAYAAVHGSVAIHKDSNAASQGLLAGFQVNLVEHIDREGRILRLTTVTDADGNYAFNGLAPGRRAMVQIIRRAGYKLVAHTHSNKTVAPPASDSYTVKLIAGKVINTPVFSEALVAVGARRPKEAGKQLPSQEAGRQPRSP